MSKYTWTDDGERVKVKRPPRPPITGMPTERPVCAMCGKKLRPIIHEKHEQRDGASVLGVIVSRTWAGWSGYGPFHSLGCALEFATLAHKAGYRRQA